MSDAIPSTRRILAAAALLCWFAAPPSGLAQADRHYKVSYHDLTDSADGEKPHEAVASIDAVEGISAELVSPRALGENWYQPPRGVTLADWIALVKVRIGLQCDFFAFTFVDDSGTVAFATRRPSRVRIVQYWFSVPPGPTQIPVNAVRETATDFIFRHAIETARPRLHIEVRPWEAKAANSGDGMDDVMSGSLPTAGPIDPKPMEALAFAAAYAAGWQSTAGDAPTSLLLEIRREVALFFSVRMTLRNGKAPPLVVTRRFPCDRAYDNLERLFRLRHPGNPLADAACIGSAEATLLAWTDGASVIRDGLVLKAVDPALGKRRWETVVTEREKPLYTVRKGRDGKPVIYRHDTRIARIDPATGAETVFAAVGAASARHFAVSASGHAAVIRDGALAVHHPDQAIWTTEGKDGGVVTAGDGAAFFVGDSHGQVRCLDAGARRTVWTTPLTGPAASRLTVCRGLLIAEAGTRLIALGPDDGKVLWEHAVADALLAAPLDVEAGVVVASKLNVIQLLDRGSGKPIATRSWPTWLTSIEAGRFGGRWLVACTDLRGRIIVLDARALDVLVEHPVGVELQPPLALAEAAPLVWANEKEGAGDSLAADLEADVLDREPAVLCPDRIGFVHVLPLGGME